MAEPAFRSWLPAAEKRRFLAAGGSTTVFAYVLYAGLLHLEMAPVRAYLAAYLAGIVWSYLVNSWWVFKTPLTLGRFIRFPVVYLVQAAGSFVLFHLLHNMLHLHALVVPILITIVMVPLTYVVSRLVLVGRQHRS